MKFLFLFCTIFYSLSIFASTSPSAERSVARHLLTPSATSVKTAGFGGMADNIFGLETEVAQLIKTVAIFCGVVLIVFSILQYTKYRKNPVETPLSSVIMLFFIGLILIALSFIPIKL